MPAITISKRTVDAAAPGDKDTFLWDTALSGFGLKITPAGAKVYLCQYRTGGRGTPTKRVTIGRHGEPWTPDQARRKAKAILGNVAGGNDPAAEKRAEREQRKQEAVSERSLEAVGKRWIKHQEREGKRSAEEVRRSFERHVYPEIGARAVETIAKADAHRIYERLADAGHAPMGHQLVRNLKALLSYAVERDLITVNPLLRIKLPKLESRERVLIAFHPEREPDPAELMVIWNAADQLAEPQRTWVKVAILIGQREDEIAGMQRTELDGSLWRIPKERHKGKRGHDVTLPPAALALIEVLPKGSDYVFAGRGGRPIGDFSGIKADLDTAILKAARELDPEAKPLPGWRWHDLRRTCGSWIEEEFGLEVQKAVLGHAMGDRLAQTYARGSGYRRKKAALEAWCNYVTGAERGNVIALRGAR
jgi:integrase